MNHIAAGVHKRETTIDQLLQVLGAITILVAYAAAQFGLLDQRSYLYLLLNVIGSAVLGVLAFEGRQWGFLLLEVVWALISLWGIIVRLTGVKE